MMRFFAHTSAIFYCMILWILVPLKTALADFSMTEAKAIADVVMTTAGYGIALEEQGIQKSYGPTKGAGLRVWRFRDKKHRLTIEIDADSGVLVRLQDEEPENSIGKTKISMDDARHRAEAFLKFVQKSHAHELEFSNERFVDHNGFGEYYFRWGKKVNNVALPFVISIYVAPVTGQIFHFNLYDLSTITPPLESKITREEAIKSAQPVRSSVDGWTLKEAKLGYLVPVAVETPPTVLVVWQLEWTGMVPEEYSPLFGLWASEFVERAAVDAQTGQLLNRYSSERIRGGKRQQLKPPATRPEFPSGGRVTTPHGFTVIDHWPSWTTGNDGPILFKTNRPFAVPDAVNSAKTTLKAADNAPAFVSKGKLTGTVFPPGWIFTAVPSRDGKRIALWIGQEVYVLDLQRGLIGQCNDGKRAARDHPAWDATGKILAMAGEHSPSDGRGDIDIFIGRVNEELGAVGLADFWCIWLPGIEDSPAISPDGKWVAFAHQELIKAKDGSLKPGGWAIYKAPIEKPKAGETPLPPIKVIDRVMLPERLSWFPDSKRILVSYPGYEGTDFEGKIDIPRWPDIVDVEAKTLKPLNLPPLYDPDLPKGHAIVVREPDVSPNGKQIVFRGLRWSGSAKDAASFCIYTCNLDGTGLKRLTPPNKTPLQPYQYPQEGVTALNIWQKAKPQRNLGVPVNRDGTPIQPKNGAEKAPSPASP